VVNPRAVVVGGGISGLAAAWRLKLKRPGLAITVIETAARFGGKLISEHRDGFVVEAAADGFLARKPPALEWARELDLDSELVLPQPEHRFSHVLWTGQLHRMPEGFSGLVPTNPAAMRGTTLLTSEGVDRVASEAELPLRLEGPEETVRDFFTRRFGNEAFERLLEPLLAGIYAGDAGALSADAAFPQLTRLERSGKTLMQGMAPTPGTKTPPDPAFRSFSSGMARFSEALEERLKSLGISLESGATATSLERAGTGFVVKTAHATFEADAVIMALPPHAAGTVLGAISSDLASVLSQWPTSSVANLTLAFDSAFPLPDGSGFVAPRASGSPVTAATWLSHKWPLRAPQNRGLARFYFGGARDPEGWRLPESEMMDRALNLMESLTGTRPTPLWHRVFRWKDAFAQPTLGHEARHRALDAAAVPGLVLAGGYFAGVGIPDCLARAEEAAAAVDGYLKTVETYL
jgi:oxygen-dependent protoporphyrinogen oxidase